MAGLTTGRSTDPANNKSAFRKIPRRNIGVSISVLLGYLLPRRGAKSVGAVAAPRDRSCQGAPLSGHGPFLRSPAAPKGVPLAWLETTNRTATRNVRQRGVVQLGNRALARIPGRRNGSVARCPHIGRPSAVNRHHRIDDGGHCANLQHHMAREEAPGHRGGAPQAFATRRSSLMSVVDISSGHRCHKGISRLISRPCRKSSVLPRPNLRQRSPKQLGMDAARATTDIGEQQCCVAISMLHCGIRFW